MENKNILDEKKKVKDIIKKFCKRNRVTLFIYFCLFFLLLAFSLFLKKSSMFYGLVLVSILIGGIISGLAVDFWLSNLVIEHYNKKDTIKRHYKRSNWVLVATLGAFERTMYSTMILIGAPQGIAVWLAFKVLTRWSYSFEMPKEAINTSSGNNTLSSALGNIYLVGNLLTLFFGILGGLIWKYGITSSFFTNSVKYFSEIKIL